MYDENSSWEKLSSRLLRVEGLRQRLQTWQPIFALGVGMIAAVSSLVLLKLVAGSAMPNMGVLLTATVGQGIVAAMFVLFAGLLGSGRARQRREAARVAAGGDSSAEAAGANRQALIGLVGTIITAVLGLVGVLVEVFGGGGGG
jgi:hypothetical protein